MQRIHLFESLFLSKAARFLSISEGFLLSFSPCWGVLLPLSPKQFQWWMSWWQRASKVDLEFTVLFHLLCCWKEEYWNPPVLNPLPECTISERNYILLPMPFPSSCLQHHCLLHPCAHLAFLPTPVLAPPSGRLRNSKTPSLSQHLHLSQFSTSLILFRETLHCDL